MPKKYYLLFASVLLLIAGLLVLYKVFQSPEAVTQRELERVAKPDVKREQELATRSETVRCPGQLAVKRKCPWSPTGQAVSACGQGYCWDNTARACKQENLVLNASRTSLNDLACNEGFVARRDRCTQVILACEKR